MGATLRIAIKDLRLRIRDRSFFILGLVAPLGLALIFNFVFGSVTDPDSAFQPDYGLDNMDPGPVGASFADLLDTIATNGFFTLDPDVPSESVSMTVGDGDLDAVYQVPEDFSSNVSTGQPAAMSIVGNVDAPVSTDIARSIAAGFGSGVATSQLAFQTVMSGPGGPYDPEQVFEQASALGGTQVATVAPVEAASKQLSTAAFFTAGMAVFFLFFTVSFGVTSFLEERNQGTLVRLLAAPIPRWSVLGGKAAVSLIVGVGSMTVLMVASAFLMDIDWGDPLAVGLLVVAAVISAIGIMALVSVFAKTADQAGNYQSIVAVTMAMVGGSFFPIISDQGILAVLSYLTPNRWFMTGLADLAGGGGVEDILLPVAVMVAFGVIGSALGVIFIRRRWLAV